ncbi:MAG: prepilin-type N-terminal cleavage/methylation domain-containing protein [Deltaproteobacteria bacterium]|nr:prepilin-type N-terminal cleavage/methylation domain-containing protein [Deltaproteobacteria bacterium]
MHRTPPASSRSLAGFTLIELMIVVAIVGVLAAIAIPAFSQYIHKARMAESVSFLADIKARQEAYKAEFGQFANLSPDLNTYTPATLPTGGDKVGWPVAATIPNWVQLGAQLDAPTRFQYAVIAGIPGGATAPPAVYNLPATDFWFVARAQGDLDGDGETVLVEALSHRSGIWISQPGGWE